MRFTESQLMMIEAGEISFRDDEHGLLRLTADDLVARDLEVCLEHRTNFATYLVYTIYNTANKMVEEDYAEVNARVNAVWQRVLDKERNAS